MSSVFVLSKTTACQVLKRIGLDHQKLSFLFEVPGMDTPDLLMMPAHSSLSSEELAFATPWPCIFANFTNISFDSLVQTIKNNLKSRWTESHREDVKAGGFALR